MPPDAAALAVAQGRPFVGSLAIHVVALLVLIAFGDGREPQHATDAAPRTSARLIFLQQQGRRGGGGGGGEQRPEPVRRADAPGVDHASAPIAPPRTMSIEPETPIVEAAAPVLVAVPTAAAEVLALGLIDPQMPRLGSHGSGIDDGAGTGNRGGNGPGDDLGLGRGSQRGVGDRSYEPGNGVTAPVPVRQVRPQYTNAAMTARLAGSAIVQCVVMPDGSVSDVRIVRSIDPRHGLDEEAVKAARQWRFRPGTLNGEPVPVRITIELSFAIY
jgi:protein TonB